MKILIVSDIHSDYVAAESIYHKEKPDFVLDCGDHDEIKNLFELVPHFYINGNHEPAIINSMKDSMPLPTKISMNQIIVLNNGENIIKVSGLDGNYSSLDKPYSIKEEDIERLKSLRGAGLDIFLTHESPLLVSEDSLYKKLADRVIEEIDRIKPVYVFSGHLGVYQDSLKTPSNTPNIVLDEISKGYCILEIMKGKKFKLRRIRCRFK